LDNLLKTSHIPYLTSNTFFYKNKYIDGNIIEPIPNFFKINDMNTLYIGSNKTHKYDISYNKKFNELLDPFKPLPINEINIIFKTGYNDTIDYFTK
jgi:hypothetical protein